MQARDLENLTTSRLQDAAEALSNKITRRVQPSPQEEPPWDRGDNLRYRNSTIPLFPAFVCVVSNAW